MNFFVFLEKYFWAVFILGFLSGLLFPQFGEHLGFLIMPLLMAILFFTFLKIDVGEVVTKLKRPGLLLYVAIIFLLAYPAFVYLAVVCIDADFAFALLLLAAMPAGVSTPALSDIYHADVPLSFCIVVITHFLLPVTLPLLLLLYSPNGVSVDALSIFHSTVLFVFIPVILSQLWKRFFQSTIPRMRGFITGINVLILFFQFYVVVSINRSLIFENVGHVLIAVIFLHVFFLLSHFIGYATPFWRPQKEKITFSLSKTYCNNALATGLALTFFSPHVALLVMLSEVPWITMQGPSHVLFQLCRKYKKE